MTIRRGSTMAANTNSPSAEAAAILERLGVRREAWQGGNRPIHTPITGEAIGTVADMSGDTVGRAVDQAHGAYLMWRTVPAPRRGELIRLFGEELRQAKSDL